MSSQLSLPEALGQGNLKWQEGGDGFLGRGVVSGGWDLEWPMGLQTSGEMTAQRHIWEERASQGQALSTAPARQPPGLLFPLLSHLPRQGSLPTTGAWGH